MKKLIFLIILMTPNYLLSQKQEAIWITFTTANGLVHNGVTTIFESSDGTVWLGSYGGANYYEDGILKTSHKLKGINIGAIFQPSDDAIWFGTWWSGVYRYHNGNWTYYHYSDTLKLPVGKEKIFAITESRDTTLWFGTADGVRRFHHGKWDYNKLVDAEVLAITESDDGAIWFGTRHHDHYHRGAFRYKDGNIDTFLTGQTIYSIIESDDKALWFGSEGAGVSRYTNGEWDSFLDYYIVFSITKASDPDMPLWCGTNRGVWGFNKVKQEWEESFTYENTGGMLMNDIVQAVLESHDGILWLAASGVSRYQRGHWTTFTSSNCDLPSNEIRAITRASNGALWFGTGGGIGRYENERRTIYKQDTGLVDNNVTVITESSDGSFWIGTGGNGMSRFKDNNWETYQHPEKLPDNRVYAIIESSDRVVWIGTAGGVCQYSYQNGTWTWTDTFDISNSDLPLNDVRAIAESEDGSIWFGTYGGGVIRYQEGLWDIPIEFNKFGKTDNRILAITKSSDGALWFGTDDIGVIRRDITGTLTDFKLDDWISPFEYRHPIYNITETEDNALWFASWGGASRYQDGKWITINATDGLVDNCVKVIAESNDMLWFGTEGKGVSQVTPDRNPPHTYIEAGPASDRITETSMPLFVFQGSDDYAKQNQLVYAWVCIDASSGFLVNGDSTMFDLNTSKQVGPLNNGSYIFKVWAKDRWGNVDPTPDTRTFTIDITQPTVIIDSPKPGEVVSGNVAITGYVYDTSPKHDFKYYQLSYAYMPDQEQIEEWQADRFWIEDTTKEIWDDTLAIWDTKELQNGDYILKLSAWDTLGHESHKDVKVEVARESALLHARQGKKLGTQFGEIEIYIPPNAFKNDLQISIKDISIQDIIAIDNSQITFTNLCFKIAPEDSQLRKPGTLSLIYTDSLINEITEEKLAIYHSPNGKENWQRLGGTVNIEENKIITTFKNLGVFALYEDLTEGGKAGILNVDSQPRIFSPQGEGYDTQTAISFDLGKESNVTIKIYNPAGRLVKVLTENEQMSHGNNVVYWDGKDQQGEFCVSGLYIVTIQAEEKMAMKTVVVLNKY